MYSYCQQEETARVMHRVVGFEVRDLKAMSSPAPEEVLWQNTPQQDYVTLILGGGGFAEEKENLEAGGIATKDMLWVLCKPLILCLSCPSPKWE